MADSPPPGYSGGSILSAPSQPVEMKVFQGGGMIGGSADASMLPQPDQRIPLTEFRGGGLDPQPEGGRLNPPPEGERITPPPEGGARILFRKGKEPVELSEDNLWGDDGNTVITAAASSAVSNEPPPPKKKYKYPLVFEKGKLVSGEIDNNNSSFSISSPPSNEANGSDFPSNETVNGSASENSSNPQNAPKHPKTDIIGRKLSNGLVIRLMPEDDSLKTDIQAFKFTGDEQFLFDKTLHFEHPVIKRYLQRDDIKDRFYDFWKLYTTYDGTDQFTLMTYTEGKKIQRFKQEVLEEYRKYLVNASLAFLLKQDKPELLEFMKNPEEEKYSLMETILVPNPEKSAEEPPVEPVLPPVLPVEPESPPENAVTIENEEEDDEEEVIPDEDEERKERIKNLLKKINTHLGDALGKSPRIKQLAMNRDIVNILSLLDTAIHDYKNYKNNYQDGADITAMSIFGGATKTKFPLDSFLTKKIDENSSLTEFLRKLIKIDINPLTKGSKDMFYEFFSRKILHTEDSIEKLKEYVKPKVK